MTHTRQLATWAITAKINDFFLANVGHEINVLFSQTIQFSIPAYTYKNIWNPTSRIRMFKCNGFGCKTINDKTFQMGLQCLYAFSFF